MYVKRKINTGMTGRKKGEGKLEIFLFECLIFSRSGCTYEVTIN